MVAKQYDPVSADWWNAALKAKLEGRAREAIGSEEIPIFDGKPHYGFYRMRSNKDGPFVPVAYWFDDDDATQLRCQVNGIEQEKSAALGRWQWAAREPVSYEDYTAFVTALEEFRAAPQGKQPPKWPDEILAEVAGKVSSSHDKKKREAAPAAEGAEPKRRAKPKTKAEPVMRYFHQTDIRQLHAGYEHPGGTFKEIEKAEHDELAIQFANPVEDIDDSISDELDDEISDDIEDDAPAPAPVAAPEPQLDAKAIAAELKARGEKGAIMLTSHKTSPSASVKVTVTDEAPPAAGHNSGDVFAQTRDELAEWKRQLTALVDQGTPKDKPTADRMADARTKLGELIAGADKDRLAETKPLRDRVEQINARWSDIIKPADAVRRSADGPIDRFMKIAREQAAERARKLREAELAANPPPAGEDPPREAAPPASEPQISVGGRRKVSAVKRRVVIIKDAKAVAEFFAGGETVNPELLDLLRKLSMKVLTAGMKVPGAILETEEGIR